MFLLDQLPVSGVPNYHSIPFAENTHLLQEDGFMPLVFLLPETPLLLPVRPTSTLNVVKNFDGL